uniref:Coiled-coil domain-containing protein 172 n=1 Tax=Labrus bergylta TaxID=56723 RepID=A0A3Q3NB45_9LABR
MSLDSLFQQILLTEQQLTEQTQKFKEVQKLSAMRLQFDLMKKQENQMLTKTEELLCQRNHLQERLAKIKRESTEEREKFLREISRFNSGFCLGGNRETESESQTRTEIQDLERKVESLHKMDMMSHRNSHMSSMQEQKRALQLDLDWQLKEAEAVTECLRAESLFVSQKPLTDSNCLLRKELEIHKEGEMELLREALSSEIQ